MAESPDLASVYHLKLKDAYDIADKLKDPDALKESEEQLVQLLGEVELQLNETYYLVGDEFSMEDVMLIPLLALIELLGLEVDYILAYGTGLAHEEVESELSEIRSPQSTIHQPSFARVW
ncbi:hypothetical protein IFM89_032220 [Coptis chinensis]|uniref:Glutathione S-transferase n=1 Tax=Coptis chinensis TaxID=261450 RepID=A0A835LXS8_9MAGN|nr:hypothetical protein IFM89_032220 [Coptis chinensis]